MGVRVHARPGRVQVRATPAQRCVECGGEFRPRPATRRPQRWCSDACRTATNNRWKRRGVELYHLAMEIRFNRSGPLTITDLSRLVSQFALEDREHGQITHDPELIPMIGKVHYI